MTANVGRNQFTLENLISASNNRARSVARIDDDAGVIDDPLIVDTRMVGCNENEIGMRHGLFGELSERI